jgi:hypothetical protein
MHSSVHATESFLFITLLQLIAWFGYETRGEGSRELELAMAQVR